MTKTMTILKMTGTWKACVLRDLELLSMWMRYTSRGESGSRNGSSAAGALAKGGMGPVLERELGVDDPDGELDAVADETTFWPRLADFAIVCYAP